MKTINEQIEKADENSKMKVLFAASEIFPFAKSGGLADMAFALPHALDKYVNIKAVMPLYRFIDRKYYNISKLDENITLDLGSETCEVQLYRTEYRGVEILFIYNNILCERDTLYGPPDSAYSDNDLRFSIFSHAIVKLTENNAYDLLHLNDWHTALTALLLHERGISTKTVLTIHNLAYQGIFPASTLTRCGIDSRYFTMEELEFYGQVNWLKGGIAFADSVTTVSPTYAKEIQTTEFGCGLDGFLRKHNNKLTGILNGIDGELFNPETDKALPSRYNSSYLAGKGLCKAAFLASLNSKRLNSPLFIFIGRFVGQKGVDLLIDSMEQLAEKELTIAILGEGEEYYHKAFETFAEKYENIYLKFGYNEALSHRMYAAADFLLMPSRFEPCGLNQMIAMRYGTIPIVHSVGGLKDSVTAIKKENLQCGAGLTFNKMEPSSLIKSVDDALKLYRNSKEMDRIRRFDMSCDFSIERCAKNYLKLYRKLLTTTNAHI